MAELLRVFFHPPPHLERKILLGLLNQRTSNISFVNKKKRLRKLSFEDFHLKSGITSWILKLRITGKTPRKRRGVNNTYKEWGLVHGTGC
jgi:hypothetical protein